MLVPSVKPCPLAALTSTSLSCYFNTPLTPGLFWCHAKHEHMPCCAIMLYVASLAGYLAGPARQLCWIQAVWQLMTALVPQAAICQLLLLTALSWCMLMPTWGWRDCSLCWHWSQQAPTGDFVDGQKIRCLPVAVLPPVIGPHTPDGRPPYAAPLTYTAAPFPPVQFMPQLVKG